MQTSTTREGGASDGQYFDYVLRDSFRLDLAHTLLIKIAALVITFHDSTRASGLARGA